MNMVVTTGVGTKRGKGGPLPIIYRTETKAVCNYCPDLFSRPIPK